MNEHARVWGLDLTVVLVISASLAVAIQMAVLRLRHRSVDHRDVGRSLACGASWVVVRLVLGKALLFGIWLWTWEHVSLVSIDATDPRAWLAYWIIGDFLYYWTHRAEHRVRLLWSSHLVHHSSKQFNLATAARQPWTEVFYKPLIALWAPIVGFHPMMYVVFGAISLMVGQWQHLESFPSMRWLDAVVSSPSNHRVHHARNRRYLDRNFGGSLIVWDRLFGTYEPEEEAPQYGLLHVPSARTAVGRSAGGYPELLADMRDAGSLRSAAACALGRPR